MISMFAVHVIITHRAKKIPLTLVGKISEQKMFATAPNPILKAQKNTIRPTTEIPPWKILIEAIVMNVMNRTGVVDRSIFLHPHKRMAEVQLRTFK